jgi:hypothetical protein
MIRGSRQRAHGRCIQERRESAESGSSLTACGAGMVLSSFSQIGQLFHSNHLPYLCYVGNIQESGDLRLTRILVTNRIARKVAIRATRVLALASSDTNNAGFFKYEYCYTNVGC